MVSGASAQGRKPPKTQQSRAFSAFAPFKKQRGLLVHIQAQLGESALSVSATLLDLALVSCRARRIYTGPGRI